MAEFVENETTKQVKQHNYNKLTLTTCKHRSVSELFVEGSAALLGTSLCLDSNFRRTVTQ